MNAAQNIIKHFPIIIRKLSDGEKVVFLLDTLDVEKDKICMWPASSEDDTVFPVNLEAYRNSVSVSDEEEQSLMKRFGDVHNIQFGLQLRKRLYKQNVHSHKSQSEKNVNSTLRRASDKPEFDKELYMEKLSMAMQAAIKAAFDAVNAEFK